MTDESGGPRSAERDEGTLEAGTSVGEYVVEEKIGAGGFGAVYRAAHPLIGKVVAIKVLGRKLSADPEMVSRFVAEARSVNQIGSKYIIDIFGFGELEDGRQYYIMEYLDGMPLDEYLDDSGCIGLAEALPILRGIAKALDAAHESGVAHRDLKPENVFLVSGDGGFRPKLLDFGIAKLLGANETMHKTRTGAPMGTPFYMSPEQCRGKGVDHRTDIYAFGCMTYRMLTGEVPFDGDSYMDILFKQIQAEPEPPSTVNSALPPAIDEVVAWLMKKDPEARPPDLASAVKALERCAADGGVTVEPGTVSAMVTPVPAPRSGAAPVATPRADSLATDETLAAPVEVDLGGPEKRGRGMVVAAGVLALAGGAAAFFLFGGRGAAPAPGAATLPDAQLTGAPNPAPPATAPPIAPPAAAIDAAAEEPAFVSIDITGTPPDTQVRWAPEGVIGTAPGHVQLARGDEPLTLSFSADGYLATSREVVPDRDRTLEVSLEKKPRQAKRRPRRHGRHHAPSSKNTIEDPFE